MANTSHLDWIEAALEALLNKTTTHGTSNSIRRPFQVRNVKFEFLRFDGKNVLEWIFKAEQFFEYYETSDVDRITIAVVHLDHKVIPWFQMMQRNKPF